MKFGRQFRNLRREPGSFSCPKAGTWNRLFYFPSEGRHAMDFSSQKNPTVQSGANPRSWVPEASMLTTRPPKPRVQYSTVRISNVFYDSNYLKYCFVFCTVIIRYKDTFDHSVKFNYCRIHFHVIRPSTTTSSN
jgi:hypothetical protein